MANEVNKKYQIDTEENKQFLRENAEALLAFGHKFPSPGGGSYYLGDDGTPWKDRNRETWITCRMVHVYSMGIMLGDKESPALVHGAVHGLLEELKDCENGGWYPGITPDNKFLPDKQCYAHAFVLLAASSAVSSVAASGCVSVFELPHPASKQTIKLRLTTNLIAFAL